MGLTIHYSVKLPAYPAPRVKRIVENIRVAFGTLPFEEVGPLLHFRGEDACDFNKCSPETGNRWFLIMAAHGDGVIEQIIGFQSIVGAGCEPMIVAFAKKKGKGWEMPHFFCKTQYASDPGCGGVANFLKCHLTVIAALGKIKAMGYSPEVVDEGGYWTDRDPEALAKEVGEWNANLASLAGRLNDAFGGIEAPILKYPNFEHLEAQGAKLK